ncbi:MAG: hypothetical protein LBP28_07765 [Coriobacteriales bacterium]|jgi:hypothetical protein|nr:hypothetical protein [Coriobacteriales bacterium]
MNRSEIEHIIRACIGITGEQSVVIIGSQAILASFDSSQLPGEVTQSVEADIMFLNDPEQQLADLVDGSIGEFSLFHDTFGIYAQGVDETTAILPPGWKERLVELSNENTGGGAGLCLDPYDLCAAKLCAHREKDIHYVSSLLASGIISKQLLVERVGTIEGHEHEKRAALAFLVS